MVVADSEGLSHGEVDSPMPTDQNPKSNHPNNTDHTRNSGGGGSDNESSFGFALLGRQSLIYSLTLDEFQHTLGESGKNFGSMNMDEFLNSIWTAEENQAHSTSQNDNPINANNSNSSSSNAQLLGGAASASKGIAKQPSLARQGSMPLPAPLCRKTVEEQKQPTFGEMTLEDFLVKAGVVQEQCAPNPVPPQPPPTGHQHQYGLYPNTNNQSVGTTYVSRPMMGMAAAGGMPGYATVPPNGGTMCEPSGYAGNGKRSNVYPPPPPAIPAPAMCYGGRVSNGTAPSCGYGPGLALGSPVSPLPSDGMGGPSQIDNSASPFGMDMSALRGRKRTMDGPVEKVVERRQRRMIKNRESAARSRARKQAYTVELEAELNQLREENAQLKQALAELERQRKQQYIEQQKVIGCTRAHNAQERFRSTRSRSWPLPRGKDLFSCKNYPVLSSLHVDLLLQCLLFKYLIDQRNWSGRNNRDVV
ncbi:hypothetical protein Ancab_031633 [Ancistrocladus abbreviatus]